MLSALGEGPLPVHSSSWQSSVTGSCRTGVLVFLLAVSRGPLPASGSSLPSLSKPAMVDQVPLTFHISPSFSSLPPTAAKKGSQLLRVHMARRGPLSQSSRLQSHRLGPFALQLHVGTGSGREAQTSGSVAALLRVVLLRRNPSGSDPDSESCVCWFSGLSWRVTQVTR